MPKTDGLADVDQSGVLGVVAGPITETELVRGSQDQLAFPVESAAAINSHVWTVGGSCRACCT